MEICSIPLLFLVVFACKFFCVFSLSLDDSFLSPSVQRIQREYEQGIPGIWKLTTNALPYELDIRSQLDKRLSNDNQNESLECILLKLNQDGTFKQCDEGYKEGRWLKGRWKLQLEKLSTQEDGGNGNADALDTKEKSTANDKHNTVTLSWLLLLAMNRQYFGPPFDVLLEATTNSTTMTSSTRRSVEMLELESSKTQNPTDELPPSTGLQNWQGAVRKGKFLRPSPGKHPLDCESIGDTNEVMEDAESLGNFSLEQALSTNSIDRTTKDANESDENPLSKSTEDDTFFFPCGSTSSDSDGGVLQ